MAGYGHYKNSQASINNWAPAYNAQFNISFTPPPGISDWDITLENVIKVTEVKTNFMPEMVTQKYKGATRSYPGGAVPDQATDITIDFELNVNESNSLYVYKALRKWSDMIYDPLTAKFGMKKDFVGGPFIITQFNKDGSIFRQVTYPTVFPSAAIEYSPEFDWTNNDVITISGWKLRADYFDEGIV